MTLPRPFAIMFAFCLGLQPASAQLIAAGESDEPTDITSDAAEFQDNLATWTGNVRAVQGEAILTSEKLQATFNDDGEFQTLTASGAVRYSNGNEAITGDRAVFDDALRTIVMTGDVIVTQGKQVMAAGKVTYWIDTGKVLFAPAPGKRIRGLFFTGRDDEQS